MTEDKLISIWRNLPSIPPYILDRDKEEIDIYTEAVAYSSYSEFSSHLEIIRKSPSKFHLGLLPLPYLGDLRNGKVFLLLANPGLGTSDYKAEYEDADYRQAVFDNLNQVNDREFPVFSLNPKHSWHGGFLYWEPRFFPIITQIMKETNWKYLDTLHFLSKQIVILELIPYHSRDSSYQPNLFSSKVIRDYVHETLIPRANDKEILFVAMRKVREWGFDRDNSKFHSDNIITYKSGNARSASLQVGSVAYDHVIKILLSFT